MGPEPPKTEYEYVPPYFIDAEFVHTLPEEKKKYWGKRIWGEKESDFVVKVTPSDVTTSLNNLGQIVVHNRRTRRQRPENLNFFTKATQSIKKEREKNAKKQRSRATARARKARKSRYPKVS